MPITIRCPNPTCGSSANVADGFAGRNVKCKKCGTPFRALATLDGQPADTKSSTPASPGDPFPKLPVEFGRYRIVRLLGRGGMGAVYLADDTQLGRQVAIKLPNFEATETKRVERFIREARAAAGLMHPAICPVYDAGQINGRPFITMAYLQGELLESAIDPETPMEERRAALIVQKVALALQDAHDRGIVHRDLKPANIMLTAKGDPVVMDFGLAKRISETDANEAKLTQQGVMMGTPNYMAPEQVKGELQSICPATDIYSLGVILFEMLTGRVPYQGSLTMVLSQILLADPPVIEEFRRGIDPRLSAVCRQAMAKEPAARFTSMTAFAQALDSCLSPSPAPTPPVVIPETEADRPAPTLPSATPDLFAAIEEPVTPPKRAVRPHVAKPRHRNRLIGVGVAFATLTILTAVILLLVQPSRTSDVTFELSEPGAKVELVLDGKQKLVQLDRPIPLAHGDHSVTVSGEGYETKTVPFQIGKTGTPTVRVPVLRISNASAPGPSKSQDATADGTSPARPAGDFQTIFNGRDLTGWIVESGDTANWKVENGELVVNVTESIRRESWLLSEKSYKDFVARFEFLAGGPSTNSGFGLRCVPNERPVLSTNGTPYGVPTHLQIELFDTTYDRTRRLVTGTLLGRLSPPLELKADPYSSQKPDGQWNEMEVDLRGQLLKVRLNGELILDRNLHDLVQMGGLYPGLTRSEGRIGFQRWGGAVRFRNIRIQELSRSDANEAGFIPLFNGRDLTGWMNAFGTAATANIVGDALELIPGSGNIRTVDDYGPDFQLKTEFWLPLEANKQGQARANSGIFLLDRYEIQILDSKGRGIEPKKACGALYDQIAPSLDAAGSPEQWQTLDITFRAPKPTSRGELTVILNGFQIIDRAVVERPTLGAINTQLAQRGPIVLQDHNSRVRFRNLRIKPLPAARTAIDRKPPTVTMLAELPAGPDKSGVWPASDGLTLYWASKSKGENILWQATRKTIDDVFTGATQISTGYDPTLSDDQTELIYADKGADNTHHLFVRRKTTASDLLFSSPRLISEFDSLGYLCAPCLSRDGLTLYAERIDAQARQPNIVFRRTARNRTWGPPEDLTITGLAGKGNLRFPFVTMDGKYLMGVTINSPTGMAVLSSTDGGKSFGNPKVIEIPAYGPAKGMFPRYVAATGELYFCSDQANTTKTIWVIRNFDPADCTRSAN